MINIVYNFITYNLHHNLSDIVHKSQFTHNAIKLTYIYKINENSSQTMFCVKSRETYNRYTFRFGFFKIMWHKN